MTKVLISGAGIAGPALALCLAKRGVDVTVVERAPALREGGQAVDFRGPVHRQVLERLELWHPIHERRTRPGELWLVDAADEPYARLPETMMAGDVEILRGDLCRLLFERTERDVTYRFGERIVALHNGADHVQVQFQNGDTETFDFVVGADGLHSATRALAMPDSENVLRHHGYRIATFALPNPLRRSSGASLYTEPGRAVSLFASSDGTARALLVYAGPPLDSAERAPEAQKSAISRTFANMAWHTPQVLRALQHAQDLYVDAIATVHVPSYARGRVVLLGDAAYGGTLGGQGTSLAIVGAYVLAQELAQAADPRTAFARYEERLRPYASGCQKGATRAGSFFAPRSKLSVACRNFMYRALTSKPLLGTFERLVTAAASDFTLPRYPDAA